MNRFKAINKYISQKRYQNWDQLLDPMQDDIMSLNELKRKLLYIIKHYNETFPVKQYDEIFPVKRYNEIIHVKRYNETFPVKQY